MECIKCKKTYAENLFLPSPKSIAAHEECIFCMKKRFNCINNFFNILNETNFQQSLENLSDEDYNYITSITCIQQEFVSIEDLASSLSDMYIRPSDEQRIQQLIIMNFKCAISTECNFCGTAFEKKDGRFVLQILQKHTCSPNLRNFNKELKEMEQFGIFIEKLMNCLNKEDLQEANSWKTDYKSTSQVYKKQQNILHDIEDLAVKDVWGLPCLWRRSRGEVNAKPGIEELKKLKDIAQNHNMGQEVVEYIDNRLETSMDSTYFQQRGYFIILCCAPQDILRSIIKTRIQIMCYAYNLLKKNMFLLCYKKLNCTALRNHAMMIALLLKALIAQNGEQHFPLLGKTDPIDSDVPEMYEILNDYPSHFFIHLG